MRLESRWISLIFRSKFEGGLYARDGEVGGVKTDSQVWLSNEKIGGAIHSQK